MKTAVSALLILVATLLSPGDARAGHLEHIQKRDELRVCHWPAYYAISFHNPSDGKLQGIDIDLARELARDLGVKLTFVKTSFARFIKDLKADKCDIAMFGVGITETRAKHLDYSAPYLRIDIYAIAPKAHPTIRVWSDLDRDGHILVVQKGTYMGDAAEAFKKASILSVVKFQQREKEVRTGRADAFLTDFPYGQKILVTYDWATLLAPEQPFWKTEYAYAIAKGDPVWLDYINGFVARIKADGRLKKAAERNGLLPIAILD